MGAKSRRHGCRPNTRKRGVKVAELVDAAVTTEEKASASITKVGAFISVSREGLEPRPSD